MVLPSCRHFKLLEIIVEIQARKRAFRKMLEPENLSENETPIIEAFFDASVRRLKEKKGETGRLAMLSPLKNFEKHEKHFGQVFNNAESEGGQPCQ